MIGNVRLRPRAGLTVLLVLAVACTSDKVAGPPTVASVVVTPGADTLATLGRTRQFVGVAKDANGSPVSVTLVWHSTNSAVATVDSATGIVTAVANGQATIRADAGGVIGQAAVVVAQVVATVVVSPPSAGFTAVGDTQRLAGVAKDSSGAIIAGVRFLWLSSDPSVATVDTGGLLRSKGPGQTFITAAGRGVPGYAVVNVTQSVARLAFLGTISNVVAGDKFPVAVQVGVVDSNGSLVQGSHAPVTIAVDSGLFGTLTGVLTAAPSGGVVTFVGVGYDGFAGAHALLATASGIDSAVSSTFTVAPGPAVRARWETGGVDGAVGDTQPVWTFDVVDRFFNLATTSHDSVRLIVKQSSWGSQLRGPIVSTPINGIVSFSGFTFDRPGYAISLSAVVNGDTSFGSGILFRDTLPALTDVSIGDTHVCATGASATFCWGRNNDGELGDSTTQPDSVPIVVLPPMFTSVTVGVYNTCGLTAIGAAYCWGLNFNTGLDDYAPVPVASGLSFTKLALGQIHTCGLTTAGDVYCWGSNYYGQLGDGRASGLSSATPVLAAGGLTFTDVVADYVSTCAIASGGDAYCWGYGAFGQLGTGSTGDDSVPTLVQGGLKFSQISLGYADACGVAVDSLAYCWGVNTFGALGDSTVASDSQPVAVYGGHKFTSVSTGGSFFSCGRAVDAEIWCWGHSVTSDYGIAPTDIGVSADGLFVGQVDACILQSGALKCWGYNSDFQLGNGSSVDAATPTPVITQAPRMRSPVRRP